ncbi:hypothetical protein [uncultured Roseovarius sp.]|uniref:hypothetical protein n=1 Tax=uncultured Roseovarius sp. TaxID=293344 RepID=UPI0026396915|nr:hypothetical protein [uncultured Roseovarius sp.]
MMRMNVVAMASVGVLTACALPPKGISEQDLLNYDAAVQSLGCTMVTEPDYIAAGFQTGLTRQELLDITAYKLSAGGAERLPAGGVKLTTGACA